MSIELWKDAPEGATHYYIGSDSPWRDCSGKEWKWWHDGKWNSPSDPKYAGLTKGIDTSSVGLIERNAEYLMPRPEPSDIKP